MPYWDFSKKVTRSNKKMLWMKKKNKKSMKKNGDTMDEMTFKNSFPVYFCIVSDEKV